MINFIKQLIVLITGLQLKIKSRYKYKVIVLNKTINILEIKTDIVLKNFLNFTNTLLWKRKLSLLYVINKNMNMERKIQNGKQKSKTEKTKLFFSKT